MNMQKGLGQGIASIIFATLLGSPYQVYSSYSLTHIPQYRLLSVTALEMVPTKLMNYNEPFLLALRAIALPNSFILTLRSPLFDRSRALKLLQSPKAIQNYSVRAVFSPLILFSFKI